MLDFQGEYYGKYQNGNAAKSDADKGKYSVTSLSRKSGIQKPLKFLETKGIMKWVIMR